MSDYFKDKVVLITGASSGIGEACGRALSKKGAKTCLAARRKDKLDLLCGEFRNSIAVQTDVAQSKSVENAVTKTVEKFGRIDILINNAGILLRKPIGDCSPEELRRVMETNYFGAVTCAALVLPIMKKQKSGAIVNVSSIAGRIGFPNIGHYSASKFALTGFSEALRQEVFRDGIFVSNVCPGPVDTEMTQGILSEDRANGKREFFVSADTVAAKILDAIEKRKAEIFVPGSFRLLYWAHFLFPRFIERLSSRFRTERAP